VRRDPDHLRAAALAGANGVVAMIVLGVAALVTDSPLVVPPIGASVFLVATMPGVVAATPRAVVGGHAIGLGAGFVALAVLGLRDHPTALVEGMTGHRVAATALALGLTCAGMVLFAVPHPPAGATTLVVSLGLVREPLDLLVVLAAVTVVAGQGRLVARLEGPPPPLAVVPGGRRAEPAPAGRRLDPEAASG
jgi:CBS-domain-containing membrane protein